MDLIQSLFLRKKVVFPRLEPFGFEPDSSHYILTKELPGSGLFMTVTITAEGEISAVVTDSSFQEPYTLHLANGAAGSFVGNVRAEYETLLTAISRQCFEPDVFKSPQAKELIACVRQTHGNELEFLWEKFPDNAIWRRTDNRKWYGALLTVSKRKLGINDDADAEIIDLRERPETIETLVDGVTYFPGWHMNKKTWYTIILDGGVSTDEICRRIALSHTLAGK